MSLLASLAKMKSKKVCCLTVMPTHGKSGEYNALD
jgi:hypothetical protein